MRVAPGDARQSHARGALVFADFELAVLHQLREHVDRDALAVARGVVVSEGGNVDDAAEDHRDLEHDVHVVHAVSRLAHIHLVGVHDAFGVVALAFVVASPPSVALEERLSLQCAADAVAAPLRCGTDVASVHVLIAFLAFGRSGANVGLNRFVFSLCLTSVV